MYSLIIVDDEYEIGNGLSRYFPWESVGFEVAAVFQQADAALAYLQEHLVDVVLTDIKMPGMSGIDLVREIYERKLPTKVILLSAYKKFEYAQQAISYKVAHYITKPTVHSEITEVFCSVRRELDVERNQTITQDGEREGYYENLIQQIKSVIDKDLKDVTLISASEQVGRSPSSVSRLFLEATGTTFTDYLTARRMEKANELLSCIEYKIYEVSEMVGYSSPKNFSRAYKKYFGRTPREFRGPKEGG